MITATELKKLVLECEANAEECRRARIAAKNIGNEEYAKTQQREGKKWLEKREYYLKCIEAISTMDADNLIRKRNELMIKVSTVHERVINHMWSEMPKNIKGISPKPDLSNPLTKKKYDDHCKQYNMPEMKRQIKHLNFILR